MGPQQRMSALQICQLQSRIPSLGSPATDVCSLDLSTRESASLSLFQLLLFVFRSIIQRVFFPFCGPAAAVCFQVYHPESFLPFLWPSCCCLFSGLSSREFSSLSVAQLLLSVFRSIIKRVFFPFCCPDAALCFQVYHHESFLSFHGSSCLGPLFRSLNLVV